MVGSFFTRCKNVVYEVSAGRAVLMDTAGHEMITLNPVGTSVWEQLVEPRRFEDLGGALAVAHPD
ncbi:MAG: PqqD family protein, partial [Ilumatobacter sp.]